MQAGPEPGVDPSRDEVEGEDRQPLEQRLHQRFPTIATGVGVGAMDPVEQLGGGDGRDGEVVAANDVGRISEIESRSTRNDSPRYCTRFRILEKWRAASVAEIFLTGRIRAETPRFREPARWRGFMDLIIRSKRAARQLAPHGRAARRARGEGRRAPEGADAGAASAKVL
jgi:hypothetical protein